MGVRVFGSAKGSPGVTTTVLALAAAWSVHREPFVMEADPSGGDIVARLASLEGDTGGLRETPSTVQLAAASRHGLTSLKLLEHAQRLPGVGEVRAVVSPASSFAATTALKELVHSGLHGALAGLSGHDVFVDAGTVHAGSPMLDVVRVVRQVTLVARPTLESILHTRELVAALGANVRCELLVVGDRPYTPGDVAEATGAGLLGALPLDPVGAAALAGEARSPKILGRSRLLRAATAIASGLVADPAPEPVAVTR